MLAFSNDYYGMIFRATQSVELFCAYLLCAITLAISAKYNTSFTAVIVSAVCWGMPVILRMLLMGMSAIFIYATPLFLVMHGCLDDVYGAEEIVLLISLVIGIICTITGFLKYKVKEAV